MNYGWEITKIFFYLALILGIIYLVSYFLKRGFISGAGGRYLTVIERLSLGPKQSLQLVKVKDKVLLIGVTAEKLEEIREWDQEEFAGLEQQLTSEQQDFKGYLQQYIGDYWRGRDDK